MRAAEPGYLTPISVKEAQACSLAPMAPSDWPSRSKASGAWADWPNLVEISRYFSAASRCLPRRKKLSPMLKVAAGANLLFGFLARKTCSDFSAASNLPAFSMATASSYSSFGPSGAASGAGAISGAGVGLSPTRRPWAMSSGWPTSRTGAALVTEPVVDRGGLVSGAEGVVVPSGFGAPGALGSVAGSKASPRLPLTRGVGAGGADAAVTPGVVAEGVTG